MTESEWDTCTDPTAMLAFLRDQASERALRLFACACCRRIWHLLVDERSRLAVEAAERYADRLASEEELFNAHEAASRAASALMRAEAHAAAEVARAAMSSLAVVWQTAWAVARSRVKDVSRQIAEREAVRRGVWAELAGLLRDLIPHPLHSVVFDPAWRTPTVTSIGT